MNRTQATRSLEISSPASPGWKHLLGALAGLVLGAAVGKALDGGGAWWMELLMLICMFGGAILGPSVLPSSPSVAVLGVDGVLVGGRFVHHADILGVDHVHEHHAGGELYWDYQIDNLSATSPSDHWRVSLRLVGGAVLHLSDVKDPPAGDPTGVELARAIEEAHAAWLAPAPEVDKLERGERTGAQWLDSLRRLGAETTASYRRPAVDIEEIRRLLDDDRARISTRAAAAVALAAVSDGAAAGTLRVTVRAMVDPRLRNALESVAEGTDDAAVATALDVLERADAGR